MGEQGEQPNSFSLEESSRRRDTKKMRLYKKMQNAIRRIGKQEISVPGGGGPMLLLRLPGGDPSDPDEPVDPFYEFLRKITVV
jgi:hypothetical protein